MISFAWCLMHIPKTAGTTLASTLQWNYPPRLTLHQDLLERPIEDMEQIPLERRSSARLLRGHVPYGVHRFIPRRCEYMTVLRQPVSRAVSAYKHVLRRPGNELHEHVVREGMGLEEFIETYWGWQAGKPSDATTVQPARRPGRSQRPERSRAKSGAVPHSGPHRAVRGDPRTCPADSQAPRAPVRNEEREASLFPSRHGPWSSSAIANLSTSSCTSSHPNCSSGRWRDRECPSAWRLRRSRPWAPLPQWRVLEGPRNPCAGCPMPELGGVEPPTSRSQAD